MPVRYINVIRGDYKRRLKELQSQKGIRIGANSEAEAPFERLTQCIKNLLADPLNEKLIAAFDAAYHSIPYDPYDIPLTRRRNAVERSFLNIADSAEDLAEKMRRHKQLIAEFEANIKKLNEVNNG